MKNFLTLTIMVWLSCIGFHSCEQADAEYALLQAESDLQEGNIELAASGCDMLVDTAAVPLTSTQMCRVAIIYAKISEIADDRHYMVSATECYDRAVDMAISPDSLQAYINNLDMESQNVINSIREVSQAINSPCDLSVDEFEPADVPINDTEALNQSSGTL